MPDLLGQSNRYGQSRKTGSVPLKKGLKISYKIRYKEENRTKCSNSQMIRCAKKLKIHSLEDKQ